MSQWLSSRVETGSEIERLLVLLGLLNPEHGSV